MEIFNISTRSTQSKLSFDWTIIYIVSSTFVSFLIYRYITGVDIIDIETDFYNCIFQLLIIYTLERIINSINRTSGLSKTRYIMYLYFIIAPFSARYLIPDLFRVFQGTLKYKNIVPLNPIMFSIATDILGLMIVNISINRYLVLDNDNIKEVDKPARYIGKDKDQDKSDQKKESIYVKSEFNLGIGKSAMDSVIKSMLSRAAYSTRMTNYSLFIMVILVAIGGSASLGTVALNQIDRIREIEIQRKILDMQHEGYNRAIESQIVFKRRVDFALKKIIHKTSIDKEIYTQIDSLMRNYVNPTSERSLSNILQEGTLGIDPYKLLLEKIERQSTISWPDITLRVAIAALTLFLVQIFFNIYKYNQQQASYLFSKAEIIELYKETEADKKDLRSGLLSKLDSGPGFGQGPTSPTEQVINIMDKVKGG
ncbi:hypothetical protein GO755_34995 [Spirosoma sp. HMF4905]|uniref:Uncharacterized protein n=2 Tax=Spirosoma arboris TaxID=2682092 RepID=A0A7K1SNA3_9BACT|nr:hypothetical protein [Spirosoma arboris]